MKYYSLTHSLDPKLCGPYPQVEYTSGANGESAIENFDLQVIAKDVSVPRIRIYNRAKPTDIISGVSAEFMNNLLVSNRLKNVLVNNSPDTFQYFKTTVEHKGTVLNDFWFVHPTRESLNFVDFSRSLVIKVPFFGAREGEDTNRYAINIPSADTFLKELERMQENFESSNEYIQITNLHLIDSDYTPDFLYLRFVEGAYAYVVSETLKQQIVDAGCIGVEFRPIEMSFNDWLNLQQAQKDLNQNKRRVSKKIKRASVASEPESDVSSNNIEEISENDLTNWIQGIEGLQATLSEIESAYQDPKEQAEAAFHRIADLLDLPKTTADISHNHNNHLDQDEEIEQYPASVSEMLGLLKLITPGQDIRSLVCLAAYCVHKSYSIDINSIIREESIRLGSEVIGIGFKGSNSAVEAVPVKKGENWASYGFSVFARPV